MRGGHPEFEKEHGKLLLAGGAADIWGWGSPAGKERVRRRVDWLIEACHITEKSKVLECGCGAGIFTKEIAKKTSAQITAVDISADLLKQAEQNCYDYCVEGRVQFIQDNLEAPQKLPQGEFDAIYGISVLHHLNLEKALHALKPLARKGGEFAFSEPNLLNPINKYYMFVPDLEKRKARGISPTEMAFYPEELENFFQTCGCHVASLRHRDFLHPSTPKTMIPFVAILSQIFENIPLIKKWSGSLWINGTWN